MKKITLTLATILMAVTLIAQDPGGAPESDTLWKVTGVTSLNLSQLALYNWAAGGENSFAGNALIKLSPDYDNGTMSWDNDLTLGLGMVKQGDNPAKKSDDQIEVTSKLGYRASEKWHYSAMAGFNTQFAIGYEDPDLQTVKVSNFMAPAYLNLSLGMDYKPNENLSLYISPVGTKITFVLDDSLSSIGSYGLDPDQTLRAEFGANLCITNANLFLRNPYEFQEYDSRRDFVKRIVLHGAGDSVPCQ